jgi:N-acetyltransferase 10
VDEKQNSLPEILCVVQVCMEGEISKDSVASSLSQGEQKAGDLIPWTVSQQFQDYEFATLSGARIVRIATHPDYQKMGYGSRALELLNDYYRGVFMNLSESTPKSQKEKEKEKAASSSQVSKLTEEKIAPRKNLPPLLVKLSERPAEDLDYIGTSFGLTSELFKFWKKSGFSMVYLRQTPNEITGEHSCIMIKPLSTSSSSSPSTPAWLENYSKDFKHRFQYLLSYEFTAFPPVLSLSILDPSATLGSSSSILTAGDDNDNQGGLLESSSSSSSKSEMDRYFSIFDIKRLESYSRNLVDYHVITDLVPALAHLYFTKKFPLSLPYLQAAILLGYGLQHKSIDKVSSFPLPLLLSSVLLVLSSFLTFLPSLAL